MHALIEAHSSKAPFLVPKAVSPAGGRRNDKYGRIYAFAQVLQQIKVLNNLGLLDQPDHTPGFGLRQFAAGLDLDQIAFLVLVRLVVRVIFL